jgi:hypothetical protein
MGLALPARGLPGRGQALEVFRRIGAAEAADLSVELDALSG